MDHRRSHTMEASSRPSYLTTTPRKEHVLWLQWYRLASPSEPRSDAPFQEMERFRHGRTGSQIILALYVLLLISALVSFVGTNMYLIPIVLGSFFALVLATGLNRVGQVDAAGIIIVLTFMAFPIANIVTTPDGLSVLVLPLYGLLILPLLCSVSFLPPRYVFLVALFNMLFSWLSLTLLPRTAELSAVLSIAFAGVMAPIILTQIIVSVVAFAWVSNTTQALERADRAEEIAKLEHDIALQAEVAAKEKKQLEEGIQSIVDTLAHLGNGNFSARVPVTGNILWKVAIPLNKLIDRLRGALQEITRLQQAEKRAFLHVEELKQRRKENPL